MLRATPTLAPARVTTYAVTLAARQVKHARTVHVLPAAQRETRRAEAFAALRVIAAAARERTRRVALSLMPSAVPAEKDTHSSVHRTRCAVGTSALVFAARRTSTVRIMDVRLDNPAAGALHQQYAAEPAVAGAQVQLRAVLVNVS